MSSKKPSSSTSDSMDESNKTDDSSLERQKKGIKASFDQKSVHQIVSDKSSSSGSSGQSPPLNPTAADSTISGIPSIEQLKNTSYDHEKTLNLLKVPLSDKKIKKAIQKEKRDNGYYPLNALKGLHLTYAIQTYKNTYREAKDNIIEAQDAMVKDLMEGDKITNKSVAQSVVNWLYDTYIAKHNSKIATLDDIVGFISEFDNLHGDEKVENSASILISSFGSSFAFVDRDEPKSHVRNVFTESFNKKTKNQILDKSDVVIPFIAAAPGVGKSRLLKEIGLSLYDNSIDPSSLCYPLFISFGNISYINYPERQTKSSDIIESVMIRMIYSFVRRRNTRSDLFNLIRMKWFEHDISPSLNLGDIFKAISQILGFTNIQFFLAIDEAHNVDDTNNSLMYLMREIGSYISSSNDFMIFPLFAGTYHTVIVKSLIGSTYTPHFVPVKALLSSDRLQEIFDLLEKDDRFEQKMKGWRMNVDFRHYIRTFSGLPRGIEFFLDQYLKTTKTVRESWQAAKNTLDNKYSFILDVKIGKYLVKCVLTRKSVSKTDLVDSMNETFSQLENQGMIMLDPTNDNMHFKVTYPIILLNRMLDTRLQKSFQNLFFSHEHQTYGFNWEDIIQEYTYLFLSLMAKERDIRFDNLFPGARMSEETANSMVHVCENILKYSSNIKIEGKLKGKEVDMINHTYLVNIFCENRCCVIKNAPSAKAGDILVTGLKDDNNPLCLHWQCKWNDSEKSSLKYTDVLVEVGENNEFTIQDQKIRNITIIITARKITDMPEKLDNDLIIVDKDNFSDFFGIFADHMRFLHAKSYLQ